MTEWVATKFDPDTDPTKPVVGSVIEYGGEKFVVCEVYYATMTDLLKDSMKGPGFGLWESKGHDAVLSLEHETRPFIMWVVRANKVPEQIVELDDIQT